MELEQEIQQRRFQSEKQKMVLNIMFTAGWLDCQLIRWLKPHGLSPQQFNVLRILRGQHPNAASANLIGTRMLDRSSNVSRLIDKLLEKKLLTREVNPEDRRSIHVVITQRGLALLSRIDKEQSEWEKMLKGVTEAQAKTVNTVLDRIRD